MTLIIGLARRGIFILFGLLFLNNAHTQSLEDLLRQVDSTKNAVLEKWQKGADYEEELPDISFEPDKLVWQTVYLPYVKMEIPRQSKYDLDFKYVSMITFHSGMGNAPTNALCEIGVMSKKYFREEYLPYDLARDCGPCDTKQLPRELHPVLAAQNGKYIEYVKPGDHMSISAYGDINQDSIFLLTVLSRTSDNFKKTTPEIFKYVLSKVEILKEHGPYKRKFNMDGKINSRTTSFNKQVNFNEKSETYLSCNDNGDIYIAGVAEQDTYIQLYSGGDFLRQPGMSKVLENSRLRDLIATDEGFAGLFIEAVPEGKLMYLIHFNRKGDQIFKTQLVEKAKIENIGDMEIWDGYDCHKLARLEDRFVAYLSVRKRWQAGFENTVFNPNSVCSGNGIHQAEALIIVNVDGNIEYDKQVEVSNSGNKGFSMTAEGTTGKNYSRETMEPRLQYGYWWGASHSFTKDLLVVNDHAIKMTVNDGFPLIGMATSISDLNHQYKFESKYYDPYYKNFSRRHINKMTDCRSEAGANYVDGLMAGNLHADEESVYISYAKADDPDGREIFKKPVGGLYDANYHTKDVYFNKQNLTNSPDVLETNVKSIPLGEYFLVTWNMFPENPKAGQTQDQMVIIDQNGNSFTEIVYVPAKFFTDASAGRNSGYFKLHRNNPVFHGSDLIKLDDYTALWARVLPGTGDVEIVTIELPKELR